MPVRNINEKRRDKFPWGREESKQRRERGRRNGDFIMALKMSRSLLERKDISGNRNNTSKGMVK